MAQLAETGGGRPLPFFGAWPSSCYNLLDLPAHLERAGTLTAKTCIFCDILQARAPSSLVYADDLVVAFMDIQPVNPGHLLVIPRAHAAHLTDLGEGIGGHLFQVGMRLAAAIRSSELRCEGVNLFLADGEAAGQEVFHVHLHVIPRFRGDGFGFQFAPGYFDLPARGELDGIAENLRRVLEG